MSDELLDYLEALHDARGLHLSWLAKGSHPADAQEIEYHVVTARALTAVLGRWT